MILSTKTTIGIVDDHWQVRDGLSSFINSLPNFEVILTAENGKDLIEQKKLGKTFPKILLIDMRMAVMDGLSTTEWLYKNHSEIIVIGLSASYPIDSKYIMMKNGCVGFLNKTDSYETFKKALEDVVATGSMSDCSLNLNDVVKKHIVLKKREQEFLIWICTKLTLIEIGKKMFLGLLLFQLLFCEPYCSP